MEDKLYQKLEEELKQYIEKIRKNGVDYAIDRAYEITIKQEIIDSIMYDHNLSNNEVKALLSSDNVLDVMYDDWLNCDGNIRERLNYCIDESIDTITNDYKKDKIKNKEVTR